MIGAELVARAPSDGHTLMFGNIATLAMNVGIYPKMNYDPARDFTPVMQTVVVNPSWFVPQSIIQNELLPLYASDPNIFDRMGLEVKKGPDGNINVVQPPGAANALGRIKFNFPNKFLVYQHDTPEKHYFAREKRAYSHGCMRVQDPFKYAEVMLSLGAPKGGYTQKAVQRMLGNDEKQLDFQHHIPVHITYQTAFVDDAGKLQLEAQRLQVEAQKPTGLAPPEDKSQELALKAADIAIPSGYRARHWYARVHGWGEDAYNAGAVKASILLMIGNADGMSVGPDNKSAFGHEGNVLSIGPVEIDGAIAAGNDTNPGYAQTQLPVSLRLDNVRGYNLHITVECEPTEEALAAWKIGTYEKIAEAYFSMKNRRDEQVAAAQVRAGVSIEGNSPERNAQVVREELKKHIVAMLYREPDGSNQTPFKWPRLIQVHPDTGEASIRTSDAVERAALIQFLEQAFEWEKLTYVCYPYFWADRATQWRTLADLQSADPVFAEFLRAGSARTVVSVRPGFESQVQLFLDFGVIWGGGTAPAPGEENYLSIADEIRAIQRGADDAERLEWWDTRLPTTLLWLDGAGTLPEKPEEQRELGPDPVAP